MWRSGYAPLEYEPSFFDRYFLTTEYAESQQQVIRHAWPNRRI